MNETSRPPIRIDARRVQRLVRRLVIAGLTLAVAWFFWRYDFYRLPEDYEQLMPQHVAAGSLLVLIDDDSDEDLPRGGLVAYRPTEDAGLCFGEVVGVPGDSLVLEDLREGFRLLSIGSHREELRMPADSALEAGRLGPDEYVILNGDRSIGLRAKHPDSRQFGRIRRRQVEKRVAPTFFFR